MVFQPVLIPKSSFLVLETPDLDKPLIASNFPVGFNSLLFEPQHDTTNKMICAPSEDSDQPGHQPSLSRVFTVRSMGSLGHVDSEDAGQFGGSLC